MWSVDCTNARLSKYYTIIIILSISIISIHISDAFAEKVVSYEDSVNVKKENLSSVLNNVQDYPKIFPQYVKSVNSLGNNQAEIAVVSSVFSDNLQVKYYYDQPGKFILEALSGKVKGSKIIITLTERAGYDGTPNGGTTVKMDLMLNISGFFESIALGVVGDGDIRKGMDIALYDFEKFTKEKYPQVKNPTKDVTRKDASTSKITSEKKISAKELATVKKIVPQKEAAQKLDPKKEAEKKLKQKDIGSTGMTIEEQAKNRAELEKARIQAHDNAHPSKPADIQEIRINMIAIQLSNACLTALKNNITTKCPGYEELIKYDTTKAVYSGQFTTKNGHIYRESIGVKSASHYQNYKDYITCVDCKHLPLTKYKQINIVPSLDLYKKDSDRKILNNTILSYHSRGMDPNCQVATIEYSDFLVSDTIAYLKSNCKVTAFEEQIVDERPYTKHDIATTKAWKYQKWLTDVKKLKTENCLKSTKC